MFALRLHKEGNEDLVKRLPLVRRRVFTGCQSLDIITNTLHPVIKTRGLGRARDLSYTHSLAHLTTSLLLFFF